MPKTKKGPIIIIVILSICLLASLGYIAYDKVLKKEPEKKETPKKEEKEEKTVRELTESEKNTLLAQIPEYTAYLAETYPFKEQKDINNQTVLYFAFIQNHVRQQEIMESELEQTIQKYFGKNHSFRHEDIICPNGDGTLYKYDSATRKYTYLDIHMHGGGGMTPSNAYYLSGSVENEKTVQIKVNILYADSCSDICGPSAGYYKSVADSRNSNYILGPYEDIHELTDTEYQSVKNQLPITTFNFLKDENNNYGLQSVIIE